MGPVAAGLLGAVELGHGGGDEAGDRVDGELAALVIAQDILQLRIHPFIGVRRIHLHPIYSHTRTNTE